MDRAEKSSWKTPVKLKTRLRCTIETKLRNDSLVCRNKSFNWTSLPSSISVSLIHHRTRLPEYRDVKHLVRWLKGSIYLNSLMYANLECRIQSQFAKAFFVALWRKHRGTTYAGMRHKQKVQFSTNCSQGIGHFLTDSQSTIRNFTVSNVIHFITFFFPSLSSACVVAFHATDKWVLATSHHQQANHHLHPPAASIGPHTCGSLASCGVPFSQLSHKFSQHKTQEVLLFSSKLSTTESY